MPTVRFEQEHVDSLERTVRAFRGVFALLHAWDGAPPVELAQAVDDIDELVGRMKVAQSGSLDRYPLWQDALAGNQHWSRRAGL